MDTKMGASPLVSIIVPVYNVQDYLDRCLTSFIEQTYRNIEIILINDGSTDNSLTICKAFAAKDRRITIIDQENKGVAQSRIDGFNASSGELIMFVDSDDYVDITIVQKLVEAQLVYDVDMVSCQYYEVIQDKSIPTIIRPNPGMYNRSDIESLLQQSFLYDKGIKLARMTGYLWGRLVKRQFVLPALEAGLGLIHSEDHIGVFSMILNIKSMYVLDNPLYYYIRREQQATKSYRQEYWPNFELFFQRLLDMDRERYLKAQIPNRALLVVKMLIRMEFSRRSISFYKRYQLCKKHFSEYLYTLCLDSDAIGLSKKEQLQRYLIIHKHLLVYGLLLEGIKLIKHSSD